MTKKWRVNGSVVAFLEQVDIEADSEKEARQIYEEMFYDGEISDEVWGDLQIDDLEEVFD